MADKSSRRWWRPRVLIARAASWLAATASGVVQAASDWRSRRRALTDAGHQRSVAPYHGASSYRMRRNYNDRTLEADAEVALGDSVYAQLAITKTMNAISSVRWWARTTSASGDHVDVPSSSPLGRLLEQPNAEWGWQTMVQRVMGQLLISGNALCPILRDSSGAPLEIWLLQATKVWIVKSKERLIDSYLYIAENGRMLRVDADDMIHIQLPNPQNPRWGISPLQSAANVINADTEAGLAQRRAMERMFAPPGMIVLEDEIDDKQTDALRELWKAEYEGGENAGKPLVVTKNKGGFTPLSRTPAEMDYILSRRMNREEIAAAFDMPPPLLGIMERATYNNSDSMRESWWVDTLVPRLSSIRDDIQRQLITPAYGRGTELYYDLQSVPALIPLMKKRAELGKDLMALGYARDVVARRIELRMPVSDTGGLELVAGSLQSARQLLADDREAAKRL